MPSPRDQQMAGAHAAAACVIFHRLGPALHKLLYHQQEHEDRRSPGHEHIRSQDLRAILETQNDRRALASRRSLSAGAGPPSSRNASTSSPAVMLCRDAAGPPESLPPALRTRVLTSPMPCTPRSYGNTLMCGALMGPLQPDQTDIVLLPRKSISGPSFRTSSTKASNRTGASASERTGRCASRCCSEERFPCRAWLERDQAERWPCCRHSGWEGVGNVLPSRNRDRRRHRGVY